MVCSSGVGFNPEIDGTRYTFDVVGLYNGLFVMADRQTGSVWTHYDGSILNGPLAGQGMSLELQPIVHTTWAEWQAAYPDTKVLDWYPEYEARYWSIEPGRSGLGPQFQATILNWDDRLPQNEMVLGVNAGSEYRAYIIADFVSGLQVFEDEVGGTSIVVFIEPESNFGLAFEAELGGELLDLRVEGDQIIDSSGSIWDISGKAISGPRADSQLEFVISFVTEWYGWAAYHPQTSIYGR